MKRNEDIEQHLISTFLSTGRMKTVARILNEKGLTTATGNPFSDVAVRRILVRYAEDFNGNPLSKETQVEIRRMLGRPRAKQPKYLFAGILRCECGQAMYVGSRSKKYSCKRCNTAITIGDAESIVASNIRETLAMDEQWSKLSANVQRRLVETSIEQITLEAGNVIKIRWHTEAA